MKKAVLIIALALGGILNLAAQLDKKYLAGAVPTVDGKVVFTRDVKIAFKSSKATLYEIAEEWTKINFSKDRNELNSKRRVLVADPNQYYVACQGDDYVVFKSLALSIDRAKMRYQFIIRVTDDGYNIEAKNIRYEYEDFENVVTAEDMITDAVALSQDGKSLNWRVDKFRIGTIDFFDQLVADFSSFLDAKLIPVAPAFAKTEDKSSEKEQPIKSVVVNTADETKEDKSFVVGSEMMKGYKNLDKDQLAQNFMGMLKDSWALVISGDNRDSQAMPANWTGMGSFGGKDVSMVMVNGGNLKKDTYTILFFSPIHKVELDKFRKGEPTTLTPIVTPSGISALSEAWLIIECKKVLEQPTTEAILEGAQSKAWDNTNYDKLFMGEIIDIWTR